MEQYISHNDLVANSSFQINAIFVAKNKEEHLCLLIPLELYNNEYALAKFKEVVDNKDELDLGQFYLQLISNIDEPGKILHTTKFLSIESYCQIINTILVKSYNTVKEHNKW